jgi:hypothetical protein
MKKFYAVFGKIREVEADAETKKTVTIEGFRHKKIGDGFGYFDSAADARKFNIEYAMARLASAKAELKRASFAVSEREKELEKLLEGE